MEVNTGQFESKLTRLEEIVAKIESGDLALDESMRLFEEGVKISRECQTHLSQAEQKVKMLLSVSNTGEAETKDFKVTDDE